ncbi:transposase, partial [Halomonas colorata]
MKSTTPPAQDISQLQRQVKAQQQEIAQLHRLMEKKEAQWEATKQSLYEQFRLALERQFGPSTEKYGIKQGDLLINEAELIVDDDEGAADEAPADVADGDASATPPDNVAPSANKRTRGGRVALPP